MNYFRFFAPLLFSLSLLTGHSQKVQVATDDGAWCWFSDPRAIYAGPDHDKVITGWVTSNGDIETASIDITKGDVQRKMIYPQFQLDDHDNPAFVELPDHRILTMFAWHGWDDKKIAHGIVQNITQAPSDILSFGENTIFKPKTEELLKKYQKETYTYTNPVLLEEEDNKVYCFGRWVGYKPNMITSVDNGRTWSDPQLVITSKQLDTNNRPYVKYYSDGKSKIHLIFTDGHPAVEPLNSVYYCYYEKGAFWKANGDKICTVEELPFHPEDASVIYKASEKTGRAWIFDVTVDDLGRPVVAYSRYPRVKQHDYHYAIYNDDKWVDHKIIYSGPWFPEDVHGERQRELNYSGGLTIDPSRPNIIYFSHVVDGVFEISRGETNDFGKSWTVTPVTRNSEFDNVRPFVPKYKAKEDPTVLLWMRNKSYIHYTDYDSQILFTRIADED